MQLSWKLDNPMPDGCWARRLHACHTSIHFEDALKGLCVARMQTGGRQYQRQEGDPAERHLVPAAQRYERSQGYHFEGLSEHQRAWLTGSAASYWLDDVHLYTC